MLVKDIVNCIDAQPLLINDQSIFNKEFEAAFASDLMSDVLALIQHKPETVVLVTGLCNAQVLRTAEMLDLQLIIFVRGKEMSDEMLETAKYSDVNVFTTYHTLYETCGMLYKLGLNGYEDLDPSL